MDQVPTYFEIWRSLALHPFSFFIVGCCFGSFLNVVFYRFPLKKSVVYPGSACPGCDQPIAFYDNIPVLAWLFLRGKCRKCGAPISWVYPVIEGLFGFVFLGAVLSFPHNLVRASVLAWSLSSIFALGFLLVRFHHGPWYLWAISIAGILYFFFQVFQ